MLKNVPSDASSLFSRYKKGLAWASLVIIVHLAPVAVLLVDGVPKFVSVLSPTLLGIGLAPSTADLVASIAVHVGFATLLLVFFTYEVRACFHNPSHDKGVIPFPLYLWAKEFVEEQQLGGDRAELWPKASPTRSEMIAAFSLGVAVPTVGLLFIGAPVVGFALAIVGHAVARHWGIRPVRPLSWHLALATLLVVVATALLSALLHVNGADEWIGTVGDLFLGLFTGTQLPLVILPIYAFSLIVTHVVVTYVGMYYLLVAYDSWRIRASSRI